MATAAGVNRLQNGRIARHMESMLRGAGLSGMVTRPMFARVTLEVVKAIFADVLEQGSTNGQTPGPHNDASTERPSYISRRLCGASSMTFRVFVNRKYVGLEKFIFESKFLIVTPSFRTPSVVPEKLNQAQRASRSSVTA